MKKIFCIILTTFMISLMCIVPALAEEESTTIVDPAVDKFIKEQFAVFKEAKEDINFSADIKSEAFFEKINSTESVFSQKLTWDVPSNVENKALLNLEYANLLGRFNSLGFGKDMTLDIPQFETGYSGTIQERFTETFGTLDEFELSSAELPDGWTMSEIMSQSKTLRDKEVSKFTESEAYKSIINTISIGTVFDKASQNLSQPSLDSTDDARSKAEEEYNANISSNKGYLESEWEHRDYWNPELDKKFENEKLNLKLKYQVTPINELADIAYEEYILLMYGSINDLFSNDSVEFEDDKGNDIIVDSIPPELSDFNFPIVA